MNSDEHKRAILALTLASILWGATPAVMKLTLATIPVFSLGFIRFGTAALLMLPFILRSRSLKIANQDVPLVIASGVTGVVIHIPLFFFGLTLTSALNAGLFVAAIPIFTILAAHLFLKELLTRKLLIGAFLGALGIGVIIGQDLLKVTLSPLGDLLILFSTISFVAYEIVSKKLLSRYQPLVLTFYTFAIGALVFLPFAYSELMDQPNWPLMVSDQAVLGVLYGIFFSSFAAYSLWQWGLAKLEASRVGFFLYLDPIVATVTAVVLLSEQITPPFIIGAVLIFVGLFVAEQKFPHYHHLRKLKGL